MLKLVMMGRGCAGGQCPTVYTDETGRVFVQGYMVSEKTGIDIPSGEAIVEVNADLIEFIKTKM